MVLLPGTIVALIVNPLAGYLADKIGVRPVVIFCGACLSVGALAMVFCDAFSLLWFICATQGLRSVDVSGLIGPLMSWGLSALRGKCIGDGSAFGIAPRQTCASVGTAVMVFCVEGLAIAGSAAALRLAFGVSALLSVLTLLTILVRVR